MNPRKNSRPDDTALEMRAIVDLVDANVSPVDHADEWEAEIAARRGGEREESSPAPSAAIREMLDRSTALA